MKKVFLTLLVSVLPAIAWADGDGADILPFSTPGGIVSGIVTVYPDGTATVQGQIRGVGFNGGLDHITKGPDGKWHFDHLYTSTDEPHQRGQWIPLQLGFWGTEDDATDGDDTDDSVGEITVESDAGVGKGSVQLSG